jgi:hypothetical protein
MPEHQRASPPSITCAPPSFSAERPPDGAFDESVDIFSARRGPESVEIARRIRHLANQGIPSIK